MNPWWEQFMDRMGRDHDEKCVDGPACMTRDEHVMDDYVPAGLREVIDRHPEAQRTAAKGLNND